MVRYNTPAKGIALALILSLTGHGLVLAEDFSIWQPRPLVDTTPKVAAPAAPAASNQNAAKPAGPSQAELEHMLKPAEPFVTDVESKLALNPKKGSSMIDRLNTLQLVLFGEQKYTDAGELLAKLAELFPQEAAKAHATLMSQMEQARPQAPATPPTAQANMIPTYPPAGVNRAPVATYPPPAAQAMQQPQQQPKKKRFWNGGDDDNWSDFDNDPFFNDNWRENYGGGSRLRDLAQGLGSLAMVAGGIAGSYYLNRRMGNNVNGNIVGDPYYYNNPYAYGGAYPYGGVPYNYGGFNPYGMPVPGPQGYYNYYPNGGVMRNFSGQMVTQPYMGGNTMGVPSVLPRF